MGDLGFLRHAACLRQLHAGLSQLLIGFQAADPSAESLYHHAADAAQTATDVHNRILRIKAKGLQKMKRVVRRARIMHVLAPDLLNQFDPVEIPKRSFLLFSLNVLDLPFDG